MKKNRENKTENNNPIKLNIMKKAMLLTCGIVFNLILLAQPPQGINYQAVVRNSLGEIVSNQMVNFRFHIRLDSATGTILYTETQDTLTDQFGIASLVIGNGTPVTGTFDCINWTGGNIWIEVEMDPENTYTYVNMGAEQFQSVPYALYSGSDWNASGDDLYYNEGNVGIGTNAPTEKLEVVGDVFVNNNDLGVEQYISLGPSSPTVSVGREAGSRTLLLKSGVDGMASGAGFKFKIADEDKMMLDENGNLGIGGRIEVFNTGQSIFIGEGAGANDDLDYNANVAIGFEALNANETAIANIAIGYRSLFSNTTGEYNIAIGSNSLHSNTTGGYNAANGYGSLHSNTTGGYNTANGYGSLYSNTTGCCNTATGYESLRNNTGEGNTANGYRSLYFNETGGANTANGFGSLYSNTTGYRNTANGYESLNSNTEGFYNTATGYQSLYSNTTGLRNTGNGYQSLYSNATGSDNTAIGSNADVGSGDLEYATAIGARAQVDLSNSLVLGSIAGINNASESTNVGIGTTAPTTRLDVNGGVRLRSSLADGNNSTGDPGQVLSSTGSSVTWTSPSSKVYFARIDCVISFSNNDNYQILCATSDVPLIQGAGCKLEALVMLRLTAGLGYDSWYIRVRVHNSTTGTDIIAATYNEVPPEDEASHDNWKIIPYLDYFEIPDGGNYIFNLEVKNTGDDAWDACNPRLLVTEY